jgi:hypothetical protein
MEYLYCLHEMVSLSHSLRRTALNCSALVRSQADIKIHLIIDLALISDLKFTGENLARARARLQFATAGLVAHVSAVCLT